MAYVTIEGYMCERCHYRWGSRTGTGIRSKKDPRVCPKCKTPYWNKPRRKNLAPDKQAAIWNNQPNHSIGREPIQTAAQDTVNGTYKETAT